MNKKGNLNKINNVVDFVEAKKKRAASQSKQFPIIQRLVSNERFAKIWPWLLLILVFEIGRAHV